MSFTIGTLAKYAGHRGFGDCKRRSPEHYARLVKERVERLERSYEKRFWERVSVGKPTECWPWTGSRKPSGYGKVCRRGKLAIAHRVAWELKFGPIPEGMWILHKCDNPPCCNPDHLYPGTIRENTKDAIDRKRYKYGNDHHMHDKRGSKNRLAKSTEREVLEIRKRWKTATHSINDLARQFSLSRTTICNIIHRRTWSHI